MITMMTHCIILNTRRYEMQNRLLTLFGVLFLLSCNWNSTKNNYENFNEVDYFRVQGIVVKKIIGFNYVDKFTKDVEFIYFLDRDKPLSSISKDDPFLHPGDPVVVMLRKKDSTDVFIAHRGIYDEDLLLEYLTKEDSNYFDWLED